MDRRRHALVCAVVLAVALVACTADDAGRDLVGDLPKAQPPTTPPAAATTPATPGRHYWPDDVEDLDALLDDCGNPGARWSDAECAFVERAALGLGDDLVRLVRDEGVDLLGAGHHACAQMAGRPAEDAAAALTPPPDWPDGSGQAFRRAAAQAALALCPEHEEVYVLLVPSRAKAAKNHWRPEDGSLDAALAECDGNRGRLTLAECSYLGRLVLGTEGSYGVVAERGTDLLAVGYDACTTMDRHDDPARAAEAVRPPADWPEGADVLYAIAAASAAMTLCPEHTDVGESLMTPRTLPVPEEAD